MGRKKTLLLLLVCFLTATNVFANYTHSATADFTSTSVGKGFVYILSGGKADSNITDWKTSSYNVNPGGSGAVNFGFYAKADKGCSFVGWYDGQNISSTDTPVSTETFVNVKIDNGNSRTLYAAFEVTNNVSLQDTEDYTSLLMEQDGYHANITLNRNFAAGKWYTLCLPFSLSEAQIKEAFGDEVEILDVTAEDQTGVTFTQQETLAITANLPLMIKPSKDIESGLSFEDVKLYYAQPQLHLFDGVYFVGNYSGQITIPNDPHNTYYYIADNQMKVATGSQILKNFRAMFVVSNDSPAKVFFDNFSFDETTGIEAVQHSERVNPDNAVYDLQGRKVETPTRGLYIINGKKVVVR